MPSATPSQIFNTLSSAIRLTWPYHLVDSFMKISSHYITFLRPYLLLYLFLEILLYYVGCPSLCLLSIFLFFVYVKCFTSVLELEQVLNHISFLYSQIFFSDIPLALSLSSHNQPCWISLTKMTRSKLDIRLCSHWLYTETAHLHLFHLREPPSSTSVTTASPV